MMNATQLGNVLRGRFSSHCMVENSIIFFSIWRHLHTLHLSATRKMNQYESLHRACMELWWAFINGAVVGAELIFRCVFSNMYFLKCIFPKLTQSYAGHSLMELLLAQSDRNQDNGFSIEGASSALPGKARGSTEKKLWDIHTEKVKKSNIWYFTVLKTRINLM